MERGKRQSGSDGGKSAEVTRRPISSHCAIMMLLLLTLL
jgi:hypothetical protein